MELDETLAIRAPNGTTFPLAERGRALPLTLRETLSTTRDGQPSIRCELVTIGAPSRGAGVLEVAVRSAPRGVAQAVLEIRISDDGSVRARVASDHGNASASFSIAVRAAAQ